MLPQARGRLLASRSRGLSDLELGPSRLPDNSARRRVTLEFQMPHDDLRLRLTLALRQIRGVGPVTARESIRAMSGCPQTADDLSDALDAISERVKRPIQASVSELQLAFSGADQVIDECARSGIGIAIEGDAKLWDGVWNIPKPPLMLFYRGRDTSAAAVPGVAVIGTREPSSYGMESGRRIAMACVQNGLAVVSGLAVGCDAAGHRGALDSGGPTIAVLAHGLHTVYPRQNRELAEEIVDVGGMLISEYAPGVELRSNQLVERDRLQAGLSRGLIVIETDVEGGTMHTVRFAQEQGRLIACINHKPDMRDAPKSRGNQKLIREGIATPLDSKEEVAAYLDRLTGKSSAVAAPDPTSVRQIQQEFNFDKPASA